jgi:endonuclease III
VPRLTKNSKLNKVMSILAPTYGTTMLASIAHQEEWQILICTILSARARDETTIKVCNQLFDCYPTLDSLAHAKRSDVERIIFKTGFYHNKAVAIMGTAKMLQEEFNGKVPHTIEKLTSLPGVGRKVANCVLVYAFKIPAIPVDTHVHRVSNRLGVVMTETPEQTEQALVKSLDRKHWLKYNDLLVTHGKRICRPIGPLCHECPLFQICDKAGVAKKYFE